MLFRSHRALIAALAAVYPDDGYDNPASWPRRVSVSQLANTITQNFHNFASRDLVGEVPNIVLFWDKVQTVASAVLFVPAYLYRLSIKSTCWLYLPLVYIASERDLALTPAHFVDRLIRGGWEWWRRILAILTLIAFAVFHLNPRACRAHARGHLAQKHLATRIYVSVRFQREVVAVLQPRERGDHRLAVPGSQRYLCRYWPRARSPN